MADPDIEIVLDPGNHDDNRRQLDSKDTGRLMGLLRGPFVQHTYLVRCEESLRMLNKEWEERASQWRLLPTGGVNSRVADACATLTWVVLLALPIIAIVSGCFCTYKMNIAIGVVAALVMMSQLMMVYLIWRNYSKFCQLWYVSKVNLKQYLGWKNQGKDVTLETINNLHLVSAGKRKGIICKLAGLPNRKVTVLVYTKSFWTHHVLDPVVSLIILSAFELAALVVQLEMLRHPDHW